MDWYESARLAFLKALIGAAWLDKQATAEELNVLKTYIGRVEKSEEEQVALKPFLQRTVRKQLAEEVVEDWIQFVRRLDSYYRQELFRVLSSLEEDEESDETDDVFLGNLPGMLEYFRSVDDFIDRAKDLYRDGGIAQPTDWKAGNDYDEFVRSRIMHSVRSKMINLRLDSDLSAREVAYITSLSALLGRIAHADEDFSEEEKVEIAKLLRETTNLKGPDIDVIMDTIIDETLTGLDLKMITRTFYNTTTDDQRVQLLNCLFLVAGADGHIDPEEVEVIEDIAVGLNMSHRDLIRAKAQAMEIVRQRLSLPSREP